ncbi:MAG: hypothetical protein IJM69_10100 [Firmicutes bacterium]|nr:hypothetical protein [Bacillota bacterium]
MTIHEVVNSPFRPFFMSALLLLVILQMVLLIAAFRDGRDKKVKGLALLHFLSGFAGLYLPLYAVCWEIYLSASALPPNMPAFTDQIPVAALLLYAMVSALLIAFAFYERRRYRKSHLTADSIKETMDLLPEGIAFGETDGTVVFRNLAMDDLARRLTGKGLYNYNSFREALNQKPERLREQSPAGEREEWLQVQLPDQSAVWQLVVSQATCDDEPAMQMTAMDITRQSVAIHELEIKNEKLRDIQTRLHLYNQQADRLISEQELLNARMAIHNEVGNVLLESRHYLQDPASFDEELLLQALKNTNTYLLREYEEDDTVRDPLAGAIETAQALGVDVLLTGLPPEKEDERRLLAAVISECATNALKHADGDQLRVAMERTGTAYVWTLANNGRPPQGPIRESGGLRSLRALVEKEGGSMAVESVPSFRLTVTLPELG